MRFRIEAAKSPIGILASALRVGVVLTEANMVLTTAFESVTVKIVEPYGMIHSGLSAGGNVVNAVEIRTVSPSAQELSGGLDEEMLRRYV